MVELFIDFPSSQTHRGQASVGKPLNLLYQSLLDSCLLCSDDIVFVDEVSGNSAMAINSTRYSTGEYLLLKSVCVIFLSALLQIKSTCHQKILFLCFMCEES